MAVGDTKTEYRFPNKGQSSLRNFLDIAVETKNMTEGARKKFIKYLGEYAKDQYVPDANHELIDQFGDNLKDAGLRDVDEILDMPMYQFAAEELEDFSNVVHKLYDDIDTSPAAKTAKAPTSGFGAMLDSIGVVVGQYNEVLPAQEGNYKINRKQFQALAPRHTATKNPKRLLGGVPLRMEKNAHGLEIFELILEHADRKAQYHLKEIERIKNIPMDGVGITADDLKKLGMHETALNKIDAGKDLLFYSLSTGGRISEPLSLLSFDYGKGIGDPSNQARSIFAIFPEYEKPGTQFKIGTGKVLSKSYRIYLPPKITKMRTGLALELGPTLGQLLEKRMEIAKSVGSRQLFGYPIVSYSLPKGSKEINDINLAKKTSNARNAFKYGVGAKGNITYTNVSDLPSYLVGANGILSEIPEFDAAGQPTGKNLALVLNEGTQETQDFFTMHNLRQSFSTYARNFAIAKEASKQAPKNYSVYPAIFQSRIKDVIANSSEAARYFMFGFLQPVEHLADFNEDFVQDLISKMNSPRIGTMFDTANKYDAVGEGGVKLNPINWVNIGGGGELPKLKFDKPKGSDVSKKEIKAAKKTDTTSSLKGIMPDSIIAFEKNNSIGKVREYLQAQERLERNPNDTKAQSIMNRLESEGTELLKKGNQPIKEASALAKAGKGAAKALPFVGPVAGVALGTAALKTEASEFADEDDSLAMAKAKRLGRAGTEVASGFSPVPTDLSLLNLLPGEKFLDRGYRGLGEILFPTKSETQAYEQRQKENQLEDEQYNIGLSLIEDDKTTSKVDTQMDDLLQTYLQK